VNSTGRARSWFLQKRERERERKKERKKKVKRKDTTEVKKEDQKAV
jgi:hypothetical protein